MVLGEAVAGDGAVGAAVDLALAAARLAVEAERVKVIVLEEKLMSAESAAGETKRSNQRLEEKLAALVKKQAIRLPFFSVGTWGK